MSQLDYGRVPASRKATFSTPSILSLACAIGGFFVDRAGLALLICIAGAVFGVIGVVVALLPGIRGGFLSILAILLGLIGVIVSIVRLLQ